MVDNRTFYSKWRRSGGPGREGICIIRVDPPGQSMNRWYTANKVPPYVDKKKG